MTRYKRVYHRNGWFELRESENPDAWISTDKPEEILQ